LETTRKNLFGGHHGTNSGTDIIEYKETHEKLIFNLCDYFKLSKVQIYEMSIDDYYGHLLIFKDYVDSLKKERRK
jgi:hypothetical protein